MTHNRYFGSCLLVALLVSGSAAAQELYVFPQKGQDQAQQDADRGACHVWAVTVQSRVN